MRYRFGSFEFDEDRRLLLDRGAPVSAGQLLLDLLAYLLHNRSRVVDKPELQKALWKGRSISASTIPTAINALRGCLRDSAGDPVVIQTVYGRGYRWLVRVEELPIARVGVELEVSAASRGFFGRRRELTALSLLLNRDLNEASTVLVAGEAGVGKTRLLEEFAFYARRHGCTTALARCSEVKGSPPFRPWVQVFKSLDLAETWGEHLGRVQGAAIHARETADAIRFSLFESVAEELAEIARHAPVIVLVDDLHCADPSTVHLFESLAGVIRPPGVSFVVAYRDVELANLGVSLVGRIRSVPIVEEVLLGGLAKEEARELIRACADFKVSAEVEERLIHRSGGNPFFLDQMVKQLNQGNRADWLEGNVRIAPGIRAVLEARLRPLNAESLQALRAASVIGRESDLGLLSRVLDKSEADVLASLDLPVAIRAIERVGRNGTRFRFEHVLLRDALYEGISVVERASLHRRVVLALREIHGALSGEVACEAARHGLAALDAEDPGPWLELLDEAARWSADNLGFEQSARYLEDALDFLNRRGDSDPRTRSDIMIRLGRALRYAGRREEAEVWCQKATQLARDVGDYELLARAALGYAPGLFAIEAGVVDQYLVSALEDALNSTTQCDLALQARLRASLAIALYWSERHVECRKIADEAVALAERSGDPRVRVETETARAVASWGPEGAAGRAELAGRAIDYAERADDREMELVYRLYRLTSLLQIGHFDSVAQEVSIFSRRAVCGLQGSALWYRDLLGALLAMISGDWKRAEQLAAEFTRLGKQARDRNAENCAATHQAYRELEYGSLNAAREIVEVQAEKFPRVLSYQCGRIYLAAATGSVKQAKRMLAQLVSPTDVRLPKTVEWLIGMALLAEAAWLLKERTRAKALYEQLLVHENEFVVVVFSVAVWRPVSFFLARLAMTFGEFEEAERLFEKAAAQSESANARPWLAHARLGHAELLRRRAWPGDGRRARELALYAEEQADELGMKPLLARARSFLWGNRATA